MKRFNNPLNDIKIASPCSANWDEMTGDERRRFCSLCNLNVYNLSDMTQTEAENFLINSEGRVCLRIYRRKDGTVLTQNCPVGLQKVKRKISRVAAVVFSLISTLSAGILTAKTFSKIQSWINENQKNELPKKGAVSFALYGTLENLPQIKSEILKNRNF